MIVVDWVLMAIVERLYHVWSYGLTAHGVLGGHMHRGHKVWVTIASLRFFWALSVKSVDCVCWERLIQSWWFHVSWLFDNVSLLLVRGVVVIWSKCGWCDNLGRFLGIWLLSRSELTILLRFLLRRKSLLGWIFAQLKLSRLWNIASRSWMIS